jgi:hypothetical protein
LEETSTNIGGQKTNSSVRNLRCYIGNCVDAKYEDEDNVLLYDEHTRHEDNITTAEVWRADGQ